MVWFVQIKSNFRRSLMHLYQCICKVKWFENEKVNEDKAKLCGSWFFYRFVASMLYIKVNQAETCALLSSTLDFTQLNSFSMSVAGNMLHSTERALNENCFGATITRTPKPMITKELLSSRGKISSYQLLSLLGGRRNYQYTRSEFEKGPCIFLFYQFVHVN